jgi:hypothetical protein
VIASEQTSELTNTSAHFGANRRTHERKPSRGVAFKLTNIPRGMLGFALSTFHGPNDPMNRPAVVIIDRERRRTRVELTNAIFEYVEILDFPQSCRQIEASL